MNPRNNFLPYKCRQLLSYVTAVVLPFFLFTAAVANAQEESQAEPLRVKVERVSVPVVVIGEEGKLFTELKKENFTILEEGTPQQITSFESEKAPLTMVLLLEYSDRIRGLRGEVIRPAGIFASQIMEAKDYVALVAYDTRPRLLTDFTRDTQKLLDEINKLVKSPPLMGESNLYDALNFVLKGGTLEGYEYKGLAEVQGRTGVLLVGTGIDTFSRITYDDAMKIVASAGVPVYSIAIGELAFMRAEPYMSPTQRMTFLQGRNALRTFSQMSGGRSYRVRFPQELDSVLESIAAMLRFQYTLAYKPSNPPPPGKKRKIKVLVDIDGDGQPDNDRLTVQHRESYLRPKGEQ